MIQLLHPKELTFERLQNGRLRLKLRNGKIYEPIICVALFPLSQPECYIAVSLQADGATNELGIIQRLDDFPKEQRLLVEQEIQLRYFCPRILNIHKITSKYGVDQWHVVTDRGEKRFVVQDAKENVTIRDNGLIVIIDTDGCRYQIRDYGQLPSQAKMELEQALL
ncbi:MAG: DUF1854 domain-containing protein [candidate division KSB1 bacterium]|nr:DUF1854 domain-containing protein [candidate division KSB1 bacterium]MDZ7319136.1 DUF1854 domain-containing protein [candidate division KSB1 bacterium]MDZ7340053.1 DUF1854 domain-containing protein [candidate division KSB1 bacterium]